MNIMQKSPRFWLTLLVTLAYLLLMAGCSGGGETAVSPTQPEQTVAQAEESHEHDEADHDHEEEHEDEHDHDDHEHEHDEDHDHDHDEDHDHDHDHDHEADMLLLPALGAIDLGGQRLRVVATTSIIGDVLTQVGGEAIDLTTLMSAGQDPHSYEPGARDLTAVSSAHVIFINGWNLEEALLDNLATIGENIPLVPISANIAPLAFGGHAHEGEEAHADETHDHDHGDADPHTWFSIHNVEQWAKNAQQILSDLDPDNADLYASNAAAYLEALEELEEYASEQLAEIPAERRFLVTNHDSFGFFARDYGFEVLGTVIPSRSTLAEPSARDLAGLIEAMREHNVCTIFTEATVSDKLAQTVAAELTGCDQVQVLKLFTGAIGPAGSGADSYIGMFRANVDTIVAGLR